MNAFSNMRHFFNLNRERAVPRRAKVVHPRKAREDLVRVARVPREDPVKVARVPREDPEKVALVPREDQEVVTAREKAEWVVTAREARAREHKDDSPTFLLPAQLSSILYHQTERVVVDYNSRLPPVIKIQFISIPTCKHGFYFPLLKSSVEPGARTRRAC
jgi:hypothetical protein